MTTWRGAPNSNVNQCGPLQAIKLNKLKAFMDYNLPVEEALVDADSHLYSGLLKCYLRELPVPLLGKCYAK